MFKDGLPDIYTDIGEYHRFKPPKFLAILETPLYKSVDSLARNFDRERGYEKVVNKWLEDENYLP